MATPKAVRQQIEAANAIMDSLKHNEEKATTEAAQQPTVEQAVAEAVVETNPAPAKSTEPDYKAKFEEADIRFRNFKGHADREIHESRKAIDAMTAENSQLKERLQALEDKLEAAGKPSIDLSRLDDEFGDSEITNVLKNLTTEVQRLSEKAAKQDRLIAEKDKQIQSLQNNFETSVTTTQKTQWDLFKESLKRNSNGLYDKHNGDPKFQTWLENTRIPGAGMTYADAFRRAAQSHNLADTVAIFEAYDKQTAPPTPPVLPARSANGDNLPKGADPLLTQAEFDNWKDVARFKRNNPDKWAALNKRVTAAQAAGKLGHLR